MKQLQKFVDFLINNNVILGISVWCYCLITIEEFYVNINYNLLLFILLATLFSYTLLKRIPKLEKLLALNKTTVFLLILFIALIFLFAKLLWFQKVVFAFCFLVILFYGYSIFGSKKLRKIPYIKITPVAMVWSLATCFVIIYDKIELFTVVIATLQRFLLFTAIMILFEIVDLKTDCKSLKTIPQVFGIKTAKKIVFALLILHLAITLTYVFSFFQILLFTGILVFLIFINNKKSRYYTTFWLEILPVICLAVYLYRSYNMF